MGANVSISSSRRTTQKETLVYGAIMQSFNLGIDLAKCYLLGI